MERLKNLVSNKEGMAKFSHMKEGIMFYKAEGVDGTSYMIPLDATNLEDLGRGTFECEIKNITLMRYIRKAINSNSLIQLNNII